MADSTKKHRKNGKLSLVSILLYLFAAALITAVVLFLRPELLPEGLIPTGTTTGSQTGGSSETIGSEVTIIQGVSIGGADVSGLNREAALRAAADASSGFLDKLAISVVVDGKNRAFTADDLGLATDYEAAVEQALAYGNTGSAETQNTGKDFPLHAVAQLVKVSEGLLPLKAEFDREPVNAACQFMPWGYTADGKAYEPDVKLLADANARGRNLDRPELVRLAATDMPNELRYQYWQNTHYVEDYIPGDADISRFLYQDGAAGRALDIGQLAGQIMAQVESGSFSPIDAPFQTAEPDVTIEDLKSDTQLIASWSSSYHNHASVSRDWNVSRMASFINGVVIQPGQKWSVNETAGKRDDKTALTVGWKKAAGILNGGYTQQVGGGVCQLGSTTFNAALRSGITVLSATHHTIPSDYVPLGLDATLSTPKPDLVLYNVHETTYYLVSYVNPQDDNVTVEVYGRLPEDPNYGQVIYDYTSDNRGTRYGTPTVRMFYNSKTAPDDTELSEEKPVYVYAKPRYGISIVTYKHIYSLDGKELCDPVAYEYHKYPVINGRTYVFGPDPATVTPTPTVTPAPPAPTTPPPPPAD